MANPSVTVIAKHDLIQSMQDALQYISYYHPPDFIRALGNTYQTEQSAAAKDAKKLATNTTPGRGKRLSTVY